MAAGRLRPQARQRWPRHPCDPGLSRASQYPEHDAVHGPGAAAVQGILSRLMEGCPPDHVHSRKTPMAKSLLLFLGMIVASIGTQAFAQSGGFPCDAFKVQPNGRLEVVRPVTITGPSGKMTLKPGISFGPEGLYMGAKIFLLYQKSCH